MWGCLGVGWGSVAVRTSWCGVVLVWGGVGWGSVAVRTSWCGVVLVWGGVV